MKRFVSRSTVVLVAYVSLRAGATATGNTAANAGDWGKFEVGSTIMHIDLKGTAGEFRPMDVLLWYPADKTDFPNGSPMVYTSRLYAVPLIDPANASRWVPLSWKVTSARAHDTVAIDKGGPRFPLLIMSHAAAGEPHNYAPTLEQIASHGYVIAAPWHNGDSQDDRRIDIINGLAKKKILQCYDGGPSPCLDGGQKALQNRALDVAAIIDTMGQFFGDRVDTKRVGMLGQSRGSVTALAVAGGSKAWHIAQETRVGAIMTMAGGAPALVDPQDADNITIPALVVAGKADQLTPMDWEIGFYKKMPSTQKALVIIERARHRVYGSAYCAQTQAAGAALVRDPRAIGDQLTLENIMLTANSGNSIDWCFYDTFVNPTDIRPVISAMTGYNVTPNNVPLMLDSDTAMRLVSELAVTFFDAVLIKKEPGVHFKQYLSPKFLLLKEGEEVSYSETITVKGRDISCDDLDLASLDPACGE
jgi:predicted dienelactone hydrolase